MTSNPNNVLQGILQEFDLTSLGWPIDLGNLAQAWGITSVETGKINAEAMLLSDSTRSGYSIILKDYGRETLSSAPTFLIRS